MAQRHNNKIAIQVKLELMKRGWTIARLAKKLGHHRQTASAAIHSAKNRHPKVRKKILSLLFPS